MKKMTLLLLMISCMVITNAQSSGRLKIYAFQQTVTGGKRPTAAINENNGAGSVANTPRKNLWLYITLPSKTTVSITEVYIDGKKYNVTTEKIVKTPVVFTDASIPDEPKTTILVPATKQTVLKLTPTTAMAFNRTTPLKHIVTNNELVVGFKMKGKKYYTSLKKITYLEPALMQ